MQKCYGLRASRWTCWSGHGTHVAIDALCQWETHLDLVNSCLNLWSLSTSTWILTLDSLDSGLTGFIRSGSWPIGLIFNLRNILTSKTCFMHVSQATTVDVDVLLDDTISLKGLIGGSSSPIGKKNITSGWFDTFTDDDLWGWWYIHSMKQKPRYLSYTRFSESLSPSVRNPIFPPAIQIQNHSTQDFEVPASYPPIPIYNLSHL